MNSELKDLYNDENISISVREMIRSVDEEYEPGAEDYNEALKSRFMMMARRIRDRHQAVIEQREREARINELQHIWLNDGNMQNHVINYGTYCITTECISKRIKELTNQKAE